MRIVGNNPQLSRQTQGTASGAITGGKPVIVNTDGTVTQISGSALTLGSETEYTSDASNYNSVAFDSNSNRIVIAFKNGINQNGMAIVGTVSGTSVSFGTAVAFDDSGEAEYYGITFDSNLNKIVIAYRDSTDSGKGKAVVGTVDSSDNSISFGSQATFTTNGVAIYNACFDTSNNKVVISYTDIGNSSYGTAVVGTVSGTSISFGTPKVFNSGNTGYPHSVYDSDEQRVVFGYYDVSDSYYPTAVPVAVSGTTFTVGSEIHVATITGGDYIGLAYDSTNKRIVFAYHDNSNSSYGTAAVGKVNNMEFDAFGTPVVFESADNAYIDAVFDASVGKTVIAYRDVGNSNAGTYVVASVDNYTISFTTPATFNTNTEYIGLGYDSNAERVVISYKDAGDGDDGTAIILQNAVPTTLTSENFIGFAHAAYADGQKATVKTTGSIARNIPQVPSASSTLGTEVQFESAEVNHVSSTYDSTNNRIVVSYSDVGSSNDGTIAVGTVNASDNSISFGTPVHYNSNVAITNNDVIHDSNSNKIVVSYTDADNSHYGTAIVGTIDTSDNSISFGSPTVYESASTNSSSTNGITFDSNSNKVVICYVDQGNSNYGTAVVGTVSGTSISFGTPVVFESAFSIHMGATFDSSNNKVVIAYRDVGNSDYGTAIVGTVSGTSISFGTAVVYESAESDWNSITFDSNSNKVVISYQDKGNSNYGTAIVGTVSGTSISFGTAVVYESASVNYTSITFDSNINKVIIAYEDIGNSEYGTFVIGTVSGTSISFGTPAVFNAGEILYSTINFDSNSKRSVICYEDVGNSQYGTAIVLTPAGTPEDLTIGQQYFVQTDGTLGTSADDPSVIAGTAIGASDLIVKG